MAVNVPEIAGFFALGVLPLGVLLAYHLRGMYVLTLHKLKPGPDSQDAFLQSLTKQHGSREHLLCLKTQKISFSGKKLEFLPDSWDYATLDWYSKRQEGLEAPGDASTGIEQSYSVSFTPGVFTLANKIMDGIHRARQIFGAFPRPLKNTRNVQIDLSAIEKAIQDGSLTSTGAPVHILNFLKFNPESWAYHWYAVNMAFRFFPDMGVTTAVAGYVQDSDWDRVIVVTFPNISTVLELFNSEGWNKLNPYRAEGLEDVMLILAQDHH